MDRKNMFKVLMILVVFFMMVQSVYANSWEDSDGPISFQIEMLPWEKVNHIIPNKATFTIIDVETGLSFKVQRRAGTQHADVQPLTKKDTLIMKHIYQNQWSWKRRAIIILIQDQLLAASMHGMPHGAGALPNGFPGHFCVHFSGSITHRLRNEDFSHKLMILKAAGKLDEYVGTLNPYELINTFSAGINQGDFQIVAMTLSSSKHLNSLKQLKGISVFGISRFMEPPLKNTNGLIFLDIPVQAHIYKKGKGKVKRIVHFVIWKEGLKNRWYIDQGSLLEELREDV